MAARVIFLQYNYVTSLAKPSVASHFLQNKIIIQSTCDLSSFYFFSLTSLLPTYLPLPRNPIFCKLTFYILSYNLGLWGCIALENPTSTFGTLLFIHQDTHQMLFLHEIVMMPPVRSSHPFICHFHSIAYVCHLFAYCIIISSLTAATSDCTSLSTY